MLRPSKPLARTTLLSVLNDDARASAGNRTPRASSKDAPSFPTLGSHLASYHIPPAQRLSKSDGRPLFPPPAAVNLRLPASSQAMQNPSSYYAVPIYDGGVWVDWQRSEHSGDVSHFLRMCRHLES